jgi:hypothetical protein
VNRKLDVEVLLHKDLTPYDEVCILEACRKINDIYPQLFNFKCTISDLGLNAYAVSQQSVSESMPRILFAEPLLEDIMEKRGNDIEILMIATPILYTEKQIMPIAMFCYDSEQKKASVAISVDILRSSNKNEYIKNILVYLEHEIGEVITGVHCKNQKCPLRFQIDVNETKKTNEKFCGKCYRLILKNLDSKFGRS